MAETDRGAAKGATDARATDARARARRLSTVLVELANERHDRISIGDVERALKGRSFGPFLVAFALPNLLPFPPGTSTVLGLPLVLIAWQLAIGRREIWLASFLRRRSISQRRYRAMLARALPRLRGIERMMQPRKWPFEADGGNRLIGVFVLVMALMTILPLPFANWLPAAACLCIGVALTGRDGVWLAIGTGVGIVAFGVFVGLAILTVLAVEAVT